MRAKKRSWCRRASKAFWGLMDKLVEQKKEGLAKSWCMKQNNNCWQSNQMNKIIWNRKQRFLSFRPFAAGEPFLADTLFSFSCLSVFSVCVGGEGGHLPHCTVYSLEKGQIWYGTHRDTGKVSADAWIAECISVWGGIKCCAIRASTKLHFRKRQSYVLSPCQITELALAILNFLTKWKSESISVIVLFVAARWPRCKPREFICTFSHLTFRCTMGNEYLTHMGWVIEAFH